MWFLPCRHPSARSTQCPSREDADLQRVGGSRVEEWDQRVLVRVPILFDARVLSSFCKSEWPTVPQLYVNSEFIGGCDIVLGSK